MSQVFLGHVPGFAAPENSIKWISGLNPILLSSVNIVTCKEVSEKTHLSFCFIDADLDLVIFIQYSHDV